MNEINLSLFDAETREYLKDGSMFYVGTAEELFDNPSDIEEEYDDDISGLANTKYEIAEEEKFDPIPAIIV